MVKPDVKHNYYSDLELPSTATIDDIRKAYRKLALQYHPDRNAGREAECVPKFQAIQAAHEVLGDPTIKAKYDSDRRKAGLLPTSKPGFNAPGNPYPTSSNFPPPPRRTQPGTWQRPTPTTNTAPSGADRFTNFPRPNNTTPRKEANTDRAQQFRAWQRMNNGAERPRNNYDGGPPSPQPQPSTARSRPQRQDTKIPSEEEIRAGMNYRSAGYNRGEGERRQSARSAFQHAQSDEPGIKRSNTFRTPRKPGGFDPSAPGSDERPAPSAGSHYGHRHRSEDLGTPVNGTAFPPPPPGPPPTQPSSRRPSVDPSSANKNANTNGDSDGNIPYYATEGRTSAPYSAFSGEKTHISSESLRRSASTRDTTKLRADDNNTSRARSTSPFGRQKAAGGSFSNDYRNTFNDEHHQHHRADEPQMRNNDSSQQNSNPSNSDQNSAEEPVPADRPRLRPRARLRPNSSATNPNQSKRNGSSESVQPEGDNPSMQQRHSSQNMYDNPRFFATSPSRKFSPHQWVANAFGLPPVSSQRQCLPKIPPWAIPSSVCPYPQSGRRRLVSGRECPADAASSESRTSFVDDGNLETPSEDDKKVFSHFCQELENALRRAAVQLDEGQFLRLLCDARKGLLPEDDFIRLCLLNTFASHPSIYPNFPSLLANFSLHNHRFSFPIYADTFTSNASKSRSEENISTEFSPGGWSGTFTGAPDVSTPPATGRKPSPARRPGQRPIQRTPTAERSFSSTTPLSNMPPPPRPSDFDSAQQQPPQTATSGEIKFSKTEWEKTFQDPSWTWPPPPPNPPPKMKDPAGPGGTERKFRQQPADRLASKGTKENPHVVEDEHNESTPARAAQVEDDAMDIDSTPPRVVSEETPVNDQATPSQPAKEPRLYSVPPSSWRQQQVSEQQQSQNGRREPNAHQSNAAPADPDLKTNLDDLSRVEPLKHHAEGLSSFADLNSTLPFESKASANLPTQQAERQKPETPPVPKAPEAPRKLTKASWHVYCQAFGTYLQAFHAFNRTMLTHFDARERAVQVQMQSGMIWLEATGDTVGKSAEPSGFGSYHKGVRDDEHVREVWNVGSERHAEAVKEFDKMRERIRYLASTNTLLER